MANLRPFQLIVMVIFGALALTGIFVFATFGGFSGGSKAQVGTVVIWGTLPKDAVDTSISTLSAAQSQYSKVHYEEKSPETFSNELANALASGSGPDLIIISQEMLQSEKSKLRVIPYASLPKRTFLDSYLPEFELYLDSTGTYGIPLALDPMVLFYNRSILASAGIATPPDTWEAVAGLAPTLTKRTDDGVILKSTIALGEYNNVRNARGILSLLLLQSGTPITAYREQNLRSTLADDGTSVFGTTPAESAINFYAQFADPAKTLYSWNRSLPESRAGFVAGDVAFYTGYASENAYLSAANPNLDYDMAPVPVPGTLANHFTYGLAYAFAIPKSAANSAGAYLVANALANGGTATDMAHSIGMAPARRSALQPAADDKFQGIYYNEALTAKGWLSPAPAITDGIFSSMIGDIITGRKNAEQAISVAAQAITAAAQ